MIYNKTLLVKIGAQSLNINTNLKVDESQKYILTAPDGEYPIEVISDGENKITGNAILTGKTVEIKEAGGAFTLVRYPFVWIFIIAILGFVAFTIFRKGYQKSFIGRIYPGKKEAKLIPFGNKSAISTRSKAELSLSIKGDKQNVSLVCLHIKNLSEIQSAKSNAEETLQRIVNLAEESKAVTYENQDNLFFIFAPMKTKTFSNEKSALELAEKIKNNLDSYNRLARQRINYGISLNYGAIVAKQEEDSMKFMSLGTLISGSKKISSIAQGEIFLGEKIREKLMSNVKTEKKNMHGVDVYVITEIKQKSEESKKFISSFVKRLEEKK